MSRADKEYYVRMPSWFKNVKVVLPPFIILLERLTLPMRASAHISKHSGDRLQGLFRVNDLIWT